MSKKETRRAARQAFPKAKTPATGTKAGGTGGGKGSRAKGRAAPALRKPTWRRAAIQGAVLAVLYFLVIQYLWTGGRHPSVWGSLLIAVLGFVIYTGIAYLVDRWSYNRRLRKLKGPTK
jgi:hypothetical protein